MHATLPLLLKTEFPAIRRRSLETLQVNVGYVCNQTCVHCHVNAGPKRTESMTGEVADQVIAYLAASGATMMDLTGGAPELNPHFRRLVVAARALGVKVIDRCNLTVLFEPGQEDLAEFLAANQVEIVASLPCYTEELVDRQRGKGRLRREHSCDPSPERPGVRARRLGPRARARVQPAGREAASAAGGAGGDYKRVLGEKFGIVFNRLYTIANMPIQRFGSTLVSKGQFNAYMTLLRESHRDENLEAVMCRSTISVDWQGYLYDCDFNQMLGLPLRQGGRSAHASLGRPGQEPRRQPHRRARPLLRLARRGRARAAAERSADGSACAKSSPRRNRDASARRRTATRRASFAAGPELVAETIYVVGGLYGNVEASTRSAPWPAPKRGRRRSSSTATFHWFDVAWRTSWRSKPACAAIGGCAAMSNELAHDDMAAGCGCAYPVDVSDAEVTRSNEILGRLRATAVASGIDRGALAQLPMHLVHAWATRASASCTVTRPRSPGWGFAHDRLDDPAHGRWIESMFREACVDVFASTHTCLPSFRHFEHAHGDGLVANNGAAGMPNFVDKRCGLVTRISRTASRHALFGPRPEGHARRGAAPSLRRRALARALPVVLARGLGGARVVLQPHPVGSALHARTSRAAPHPRLARRLPPKGVPMSRSKLLVVVVIVALIASFFVFDLRQYFTLEYIKGQQAAFAGYVEANAVTAAVVYFLVYVAVTGLSLPGAAILTLLGGAIFGLLWGS
jgi:radical SAM/Cys-rich protein